MAALTLKKEVKYSLTIDGNTFHLSHEDAKWVRDELSLMLRDGGVDTPEKG